MATQDEKDIAKKRAEEVKQLLNKLFDNCLYMPYNARAWADIKCVVADYTVLTDKTGTHEISPRIMVNIEVWTKGLASIGKYLMAEYNEYIPVNMSDEELTEKIKYTIDAVNIHIKSLLE